MADHAAWGGAAILAVARADYHLPRPGEIVNAHDPSRFRDILRLRVAAGDAMPWAV